RGIRQVWRGSNEALGQICCPESLLSEREFYHIPPALLDACFQVAQLALLSATEQACYLPVGLDRLIIYQRPEEELWSYAVFSEKISTDMPEVQADLFIVDRQGQRQVEIQGLRLRRISRLAQLTSMSLLQHYGYILHDVVEAGNAAQRRELLQEYLCQRIAQVTGYPRSQLTGTQQLEALALDSIVLVELKQSIEEDLRIDVPIKSLAQSSSIGQLAEQLVEQVTSVSLSGRRVFTPAPHERNEPFPLNYTHPDYW